MRNAMTYLIHHHNLNSVHFRYTLLDQVQYPAWSGDDNMHYKSTRKAKEQGHSYILEGFCVRALLYNTGCTRIWSPFTVLH